MEEQKKYTILIVDDNEDVRRLLKKVLEAASFSVIEAGSGSEALAAVEEVIPDLVLMDIRLPGGMNGLETTASLTEDPRMKRVPIIALTASVTERDRQQALAAGCSGFIAKPVDVTALPEIVRNFISRGASR